MKTNFILFTLFFLSMNIFAQEENSMPKKDPFEKETELAVSRIKEQEVEKQIMESSELLKGCKEKETLTDKENCIKEKVENMDPGEVEKLSKNLDLESFDKQAAKSTTSIKDYLSKRIENALRGSPKDKSVKEMNLKDLKFVDHAVYATLYRSQIGKNILLEVSNYCLANLGLKNHPETLVSPCLTGSCNTKNVQVTFDANNKQNVALNSQVINVGWDVNAKKEDPTKAGVKSLSYINLGSNFWKDNAFEYSTCDETSVNGNSSNNCNAKYSKPTGLLEKLKDVEFSLGGEYLKEKVSFCSLVVVKNMCEKYRCTHVYSKKTDTQIDPKTGVGKNQKFCSEELGIDITRVDPLDKIPTENTFKSDGTIDVDVSGIKACALVERLKEYRRVVAALDEIDKFNKDNKGKARGLSLGDSKAFKGQYNGGSGSGEKSIEEITTISSKEFAEVEFNKGQDLEELKKKCFQGGVLAQDKECQELSANLLDAKKSDNISAEMEAETEVYLKRVQELAKANDKESLNEYLRQNGLERYIDSELTEQQLADLISDQYKSERAALKSAMMEKYKKLTQPDPNATNQGSQSNDQQLVKTAEETIANMEQQKAKIKTLVQYNNIITSYMGASIGEGDNKQDTELTYQREIEMDNLAKSKDQKDIDNVATYNEYFKDSSQGQSGSANTNLQVDLNFIDSLLGTTNNQAEEQ